jgi:hypothetical protein
MTFSAGPNTDTVFVKGDNIEVTGYPRFHIEQVGVRNRTLQLTSDPPVNVVNSNLKWYRIREPNTKRPRKILK